MGVFYFVVLVGRLGLECVLILIFDCVKRRVRPVKRVISNFFGTYSGERYHAAWGEFQRISLESALIFMDGASIQRSPGSSPSHNKEAPFETGRRKKSFPVRRKDR